MKRLELKRIFAGAGAAGGRRGIVWIPLFAALALAALLLNLGLTQFVEKGSLAQDGYAVPKGQLTKQLQNGDAGGSIGLVGLSMGDTVYARAIGSNDLYVGEDKVGVDAGYPMYLQSGQVLYFLDDSMSLVSEDWNVLQSYEGLYLTDGITFNEDRSQADIERISLVRVEGGYQLAQRGSVTSGTGTASLPMNSICAFGEDGIVCYAYSNGRLKGESVDVALTDDITIGGDTYTYSAFLEKLGLWEEAAERDDEAAPTQEPTPVPTEETDEGGEDDKNLSEKPLQNGSDESTPLPLPTDQQEQEHKPRPSSVPATPAPASDVVAQPGAAVPNENETPAAPAAPQASQDKNPDYRDPVVSFGDTLTPWVYTISVQAVVEDTAGVMDGGVQIYVFETTDGGEKQVLRRAVTTSGEVALGQLKPGTSYHITAKYSYHDKYNYPRTVELDVGSTATLAFDTLQGINIAFEDENTVVPASSVEVFSNRIQLRSLALPDVANGEPATEAGAITQHPAVDALRSETYINTVTLTFTAQGSSQTQELKMDGAALRLLREGYTLAHWETAEELKSGTKYDFTLTLKDKYGNVFAAADGAVTQGAGHTCRLAPTVSISVPGTTNVSGSTQIQVTWRNADNAAVAANTGAASAMGGETKAALYLVRKGDAVIPANAVALSGYTADEPSAKVEGQKFLPVTVNSDGTVTNVKTSWVVTNLQVLQNYTAAVLCGSYDIEDGKTHLDETLAEPTSFLTASLSSLGAVSYTSEADEVSFDTARLKFRMNSTDERLAALLSEISFTLYKKGAIDSVQKLTLKAESLDVPITIEWDAAAGLYTGAAQIPVFIDGAEAASYYTTVSFTGKTMPAQESGTVWELIINSSAFTIADESWICLDLGSSLTPAEEGVPDMKLMPLEPKTSYIGKFATTASQGGFAQDVTSAKSKTLNFTTMSQMAVVDIANIFVSTNFVELYGMRVYDPDSCIQVDDANRGGNNVQIRILSESGVLVASQYIKSETDYDTLHISGLENGKTYTMVFSAAKYNISGAVEKNYALQYAKPQNEASPEKYVFTTGESVVGDISLSGISQLYANVDGTVTDSINVLSADDYYTGVWLNYERLYAAENNTLSQAENVESTPELATFMKEKQRVYSANEYYSPDTIANCWTTRFIPVSEGQLYSMYNVTNVNNAWLTIAFYGADADGMPVYKNSYRNSAYQEDGIFAVPAGVSYMRISGLDIRNCASQILELYDPQRTEASTQLFTDSVAVETGVRLSPSNGMETSVTMGFTSDYIPVTGGSIYELRGRDPNRPDAAGQTAASNSTSDAYLLFYGSDYTFLGSYTASAQTALIKAPFGAAYCRLDFYLDASSGTLTLKRDNLSLKLYKAAISDQFLVTLQTVLTDSSSKQLLTGGSYTVTLYTTTGKVSDSSDLSTQNYEQLGDAKSYVVDASAMPEGKLDVNRYFSFDKLSANRGFKATLEIRPAGWEHTVLLDTVYFTTNRVVHTISDIGGLMGILSDPAASYVVTADIEGVTAQVLTSAKPFTGTIDFQGHSVTVDSFLSLFNTVSKGGVVKNLVLNYNARGSSTTPYIYFGGVCAYNYGTLQNIVLRLDVENTGGYADVTQFGGVCYTNYGSIENFAVDLMSDIRVANSVGCICAYNYGSVSNGYVCAREVTDGVETRTAQLQHIYSGISASAAYISYGVGINYSSGSISNVFALGDLVLQSADASTETANSDITEANDPSATNTGYSAIMVGANGGVFDNGFTVGDRLDFNPAKGQYNYMLQRGPAIGTVNSRYHAENLTYFAYSVADYDLSTAVSAYNVRGSFKNLYDYQWYYSVLGDEGEHFNIRENIDNGYYPRLVLPECFGADAQTPIELPSKGRTTVEVENTQVRLQGTEYALATITLDYPYAGEYLVTGFTLVDRNNLEINCEVLAQHKEEKEYRVDVLLSLPEGAAADSSYTITGVTWEAGGTQQLTSGLLGPRQVSAEFWQELDSVEQWRATFAAAGGSIYGNYILTQDIDFSYSASASDWYVSRYFYGKLDGGIYSLAQRSLTDSTGSVITDADGAPRTIEVRETLTGMHTISGVGNCQKQSDDSWLAVTGRSTSGRSSLFLYLNGTMKNIVFRDFHNNVDTGKQSVAGSTACGVVARMQGGSIVSNCHVRDSEFYGIENVGALVGSASGGTVLNCSARDVSVNSFRNDDTTTNSLKIGGVVGSLDNTSMSGCFACDVDVRALDVYSITGAGALVGYVNNAEVEDCYATGLVETGSANTGGITGAENGVSSITGCWSTATVSTVSDYAAGVVGYHNGGVLKNNFTSSTVMTRSMSTNYVHRITSLTTFDQNNRVNNYAFDGQYLTYFDASAAANGGSAYQYGTWTALDGATALLGESQMRQPNVWSGIICVGDSYDLYGSGVSGGVSGGTRATGVADGYMPKLTASDGQLLYDQPDVVMGQISSSRLEILQVDQQPAYEYFDVTLALFTDAADIQSMDFSSIADWAAVSAVGGKVDTAHAWDSSASVAGVLDMGAYSENGAKGRELRLRLYYGGSCGADGHYLDKYLLSVPLKDSSGRVCETLQVYVNAGTPIYKIIYTVDQWDEFFSDPKYAATYENVQIGWSSDNNGTLDFSQSSSYSAKNGKHIDNVRVNRLDGMVKPGTQGDTAVYPTLENYTAVFKTAGRSMISQAVTSMSNLHFENINVSSTWTDAGNVKTSGGSNKGVVGIMLGDMTNVTFTNIKVDGGSGAYVGCVGALGGAANKVVLKNIVITTTGSYVGGFVGQSQTASTMTNISLVGDGENRNTVAAVRGSYAGGITGSMLGIASDLTVDDTDISARSYAGGITGYANGNGGRPTEYKLQRATVGNSGSCSDIPGASAQPDVTVTLRDDSSVRFTYVGGAVGSGGGQRIQGINVYNTKVSVPSISSGDMKDGTLTYYCGGIVGSACGQLMNSLAENCTVESWGGWCGGICSETVGSGNIVRSCVVRGIADYSTNVGGITASGVVNGCYVQRSVISGGTNVGGLLGYKNSTSTHENGVTDSVVLGVKNVGGAVGCEERYYIGRCHVTASTDTFGEATVTTAVTGDMLSNAVSGYAEEYKGTYVKGNANVGGVVGLWRGSQLYNCVVTPGVTVEGNDATGGLVGRFVGWYSDFIPTSNRYLYSCAMGAQVKGGKNTGGIMGVYDTSSGTGAPASIVTDTGADPSYMNSVLLTGSVTGGEDANIIYPGAAADGKGFAYCRVYEGVTVNGSTVGGLNSYDTVKTGAAPADRAAFAELLTVTAEDLQDENLYFAARNTTYGGMGWGRSTWSGETLEMLYAQQSAPADFTSYKSGIAQSDLVLWLDARNNTGSFGTDASATTWKDLSGSKNDATLYWNNKTSAESVLITERMNYMRWNSGALEFTSSIAGYYAQLQESLTQYLQNGYTVELVMGDYSNYYSSTIFPLRGYLGGVYCGFGLDFRSSRNVYWKTTASSSVTAFNSRRTDPEQQLQTVTYAADSSGAGMQLYINGVAQTYKNAGTYNYNFTQDTDVLWRISPEGIAGLRVYGVRVYNRQLSAAEAAKNAAYDAWYYFGGDRPSDATSVSQTITLGDDGSVPDGTGTYTLYRSDDGNYNGTIVCENYTARSLGSRGYYYVRDSAGNYSNVVQILSPAYAPQLQVIGDVGSIYYGVAAHGYPLGQEGGTVTKTGYVANSIDDKLYYGGCLLPEAGLVSRSGSPLQTASGSRSLFSLGSLLPEVSAYASGVSSVNIELDCAAEEGLSYEIATSDGVVLSGDWPVGGRTLTMTWDYETAFTVKLIYDGDESETEFTYADLARTVMTHGSGYWYLYGSECYDSAGESVDESVTFLHMMDGKLLDDGGSIWSADTGEICGSVTPFMMLEPCPVWQGSVNGAYVESFGTYMLTDGGEQATQLVVKGSAAYTMPAYYTVVGSFVVDSYGGNVYNTVLGTDGVLCDMGEALCYPEDFSTSGIREMSNTLDYSGHIVLVRYRSGKLAAFDYLTGETVSVLSSESGDTSLGSFIMDTLRGLTGSSLLSGGAQQAQSAVDYQSQVESDPSLQTALSNLKANEQNTTVTDGEGSGVYSDTQSAGADGVADAGNDASNGLDSTSGQVGAADGAASAMPTETAQPTEETAQPADASQETAATTAPESTDAAQSEPAATETASPTPQQSGDAQTDDVRQDTAVASGQSASVTVYTKYVTVYDPKTDTSTTYELDELLQKPAEELVSEQERAGELEKMGFTTTLLTNRAAQQSTVRGLVLMLLTAAGTVLMLIYLARLKKHKVDKTKGTRS